MSVATESRDEAAPEERAPAASEQISLIVENMHCGACILKVERALKALDGVDAARVNLTARRVQVETRPDKVTIKALLDALAGIGYHAAEMAALPPDAAQMREQDLLRRIGVAGFAAANIMLLSTAVWAGMASDMGPGIAAVFHWISGGLALPAVAYAGQPFFKSAYDALRVRRLNMDVPISVAICLATGMSLFQTIRGSEQVYFDAAVTLLFFLLIGRFLDQRVRVRAAGAAQNLLALKAAWASVVNADGSTADMPARELKPGQRVLIAAGGRVPADGVVRGGRSDVDESLISGETVPRLASPGTPIYAGTMNLSGPLEMEVSAAGGNTLLDEIGRLMAAAEQGRGRYVRLADRAARLYAPAVHLLGASTFLGWLAIGAGWEQGLTAAIAVLIITCPCALALAVPAVQVAATSRLLRKGLILKAPDGLERLAEVDTIVLDKTGTLTTGEPELIRPEHYDEATLRVAATLAAASRHPYARALVHAATARLGPIPVAANVEEHPGQGLSRIGASGEERLGSASFVGSTSAALGEALWYRSSGGRLTGFTFSDRLRPHAAEVAAQLRQAGFEIEVLSGDRPERVATVAAEAGIERYRGGQSPAEKLQRLAALRAEGRRVLMVGDGLNDAPALAAGHASLSPATAADISQTAADAVWQGASLAPLAEILGVARASHAMALQNFGVALAYNLVSVPAAMLGHVTPLIAAIAMSTSSVVVTVNALRLYSRRCQPKAHQR